MALGFQSIIYRLLGSIPGPLLFGALIDNTCLYWDHEADCSEGNCWLYDQKKLRLVFFMYGIVFKGISSLCFFFAWRVYANGNYGDSDEQEKEVATPSGFELDAGTEETAVNVRAVDAMGALDEL